MTKEYFFNYDFNQASAYFEVDTNVFTDDQALEILNKNVWDYDKSANPTDEMMKKYAIEALKSSTFNNYDTNDVINDFNRKEGFIKIDGSQGIVLTKVSPYDIAEEYLAFRVTFRQ